MAKNMKINQVSPTTTNAFSLTMPLGGPSDIVVLDEHASPFVPSPGIWSFLSTLQAALTHQQQEMSNLALKCQELEFKNAQLEQTVAGHSERIEQLESLIEEIKMQEPVTVPASQTNAWTDIVKKGKAEEINPTTQNQTTRTYSDREDNVDASEQIEREKRAHNIVIRGIPEKEKETPLSLAKDVGEFFAEHFAMQEVVVFGAHRVGRKRDETSRRAIVCTMLDTRKREIILDSSRIYLKGTSFYVTEDRTPRQQEERRRMYEDRVKRKGQGAEQAP